MEYSFIKVQHENKIAKLTFNRPNVLNALSIPMLKEIATALSEISRAEILVIKGEGKAFCVGADVKERKKLTFETYLMERALTLQKIASLLRNMEGIILAALHGYVIGGGLVISLYADFRIAAENTIFRIPEIDVGSTILCGGYKTLVENIGVCRAKELLLMGEKIGASEAERINLIHKKVSVQKLEEIVNQYVGKLAKKSVLARKLVKKSIMRALDRGFDGMLSDEILDAAKSFYYPLKGKKQ